MKAVSVNFAHCFSTPFTVEVHPRPKRRIAEFFADNSAREREIKKKKVIQIGKARQARYQMSCCCKQCRTIARRASGTTWQLVGEIAADAEDDEGTLSSLSFSSNSNVVQVRKEPSSGLTSKV